MYFLLQGIHEFSRLSCTSLCIKEMVLRLLDVANVRNSFHGQGRTRGKEGSGPRGFSQRPRRMTNQSRKHQFSREEVSVTRAPAVRHKGGARYKLMQATAQRLSKRNLYPCLMWAVRDVIHAEISLLVGTLLELSLVLPQKMCFWWSKKDFGIFVGEEKEKGCRRQEEVVLYKTGWADTAKIKLSSMTRSCLKTTAKWGQLHPRLCFWLRLYAFVSQSSEENA